MNSMDKKPKKVKTIPITPGQADTIASGIRETLNLSEDVQVGVFAKRKIPSIPNYTMIFQAVGFLMINEITPSSLKLLWYFVTKLQYSNHIGIDQKTMMEETGLSIQTVKASIKQLKDKNIIISYDDVQDNRRNVYIINPNLAWRGTSMERVKTLKKIMGENPNQLTLFGKLNAKGELIKHETKEVGNSQSGC